jgi:hypothetical protein
MATMTSAGAVAASFPMGESALDQRGRCQLTVEVRQAREHLGWDRFHLDFIPEDIDCIVLVPRRIADGQEVVTVPEFAPSLPQQVIQEGWITPSVPDCKGSREGHLWQSPDGGEVRQAVVMRQLKRRHPNHAANMLGRAAIPFSAAAGADASSVAPAFSPWILDRRAPALAAATFSHAEMIHNRSEEVYA